MKNMKKLRKRKRDLKWEVFFKKKRKRGPNEVPHLETAQKIDFFQKKKNVVRTREAIEATQNQFLSK